MADAAQGSPATAASHTSSTRTLPDNNQQVGPFPSPSTQRLSEVEGSATIHSDSDFDSDLDMDDDGDDEEEDDDDDEDGDDDESGDSTDDDDGDDDEGDDDDNDDKDEYEADDEIDIPGSEPDSDEFIVEGASESASDSDSEIERDPDAILNEIITLYPASETSGKRKKFIARDSEPSGSDSNEFVSGTSEESASEPETDQASEDLEEFVVANQSQSTPGSRPKRLCRPIYAGKRQCTSKLGGPSGSERPKE